MSQYAVLRPYGFSQPSYVSVKPKRHLDRSFDDADLTPCSSDNDSNYPAHASKSHSRSSSTSRPRTAAPNTGLRLQISHKQQRTLPEAEDAPHRSRAHEKPRPSRVQTSRHVRHSSLVSPITPTTANKFGEMQLRAQPADLSMAEEIANVRTALRRAEIECQKLRDQMETNRVDRYRLERELEEARKENRRLAARLEGLLKSPLSARSDDGWGCSMYDHEVDGRY